MHNKALLFTALTCLTTYAAIEPRVFVNGAHDARVTPGKPAVLEMKYIDTDEKGEQTVVKDIKTVMGKTMHLVIVKSDLSTFAHFHPVFDSPSGLFQAPLHLATVHPDNQDAVRAMPEAGHYLLYSEAKSTDKGLLIHALDHTTTGESFNHTLLIDTPNEKGIYVKYLDGQGDAAEEGAKYRTLMTISETAGVGGDLIHFSLLLEERGADGTYKEVESLQPWLMMGGHAILLGSRGDTAKDRVFAHEHSGKPETGGTLKFAYFARGGMPRDTYRLWMQLKHSDRVLTVPLTFRYPF